MSQLYQFLSEKISKNKFFAGLEGNQFFILAQLIVDLEFKQTDEIVGEGDSDTSLFIIHSGEIGIYKSIDQGRVQLAKALAGETIGEISFIDGQKRSATLIANTAVNILQIQRKPFFDMAVNYPRLGHVILEKLANILCRRLASTSSKLINTAVELEKVENP